MPERVAEYRRSLPRQNTAQLDAPILFAPVGRAGKRGRTQEQSARHTAAGGKAPKVRLFAVELAWQSIRAVHVLFDDRFPATWKIPCELRHDAGIIERKARRQNQWAAVVAFP